MSRNVRTNVRRDGRCVRSILQAQRAAVERGHAAPNITADELRETLVDNCAICGCNERDLPKRLSMDHCHATGEFRGWLCDRCNTVLGRIQDDAELAEKIHLYLKGRA